MPEGISLFSYLSWPEGVDDSLPGQRRVHMHQGRERTAGRYGTTDWSSARLSCTFISTTDEIQQVDSTGSGIEFARKKKEKFTKNPSDHGNTRAGVHCACVVLCAEEAWVGRGVLPPPDRPRTATDSAA